MVNYRYCRVDKETVAVIQNPDTGLSLADKPEFLFSELGIVISILGFPQFSRHSMML